MQLFSEPRSMGGLGYNANGPAMRFNQDPYTTGDYHAQTNQMYAPGGSGYSGRGIGSPNALQSALSGIGYGVGSPEMNTAFRNQGWMPPVAPPAAAPGGGQPGGGQPGMGQYNTGIPQYNPAPFGSAMGLINPGWMGVSQAGQQQAGQQSGDLLRQMQFGGALDLTQQANLQNTQQQLAHQQAGANAGLQFGGLGLGAYQNMLGARAPFDQFAASMGSMPLRAVGGLLGSMFG